MAEWGTGHDDGGYRGGSGGGGSYGRSQQQGYGGGGGGYGGGGGGYGGGGGGYQQRREGGGYQSRDGGSRGGYDRRGGGSGGGSFGGGGAEQYGDSQKSSFQIPTRIVGRVIGKGGSRIKNIQDESGARVKVHSNRETHTDMTSVDVFGDEGARVEAERQIQQIVNQDDGQ